MRLFNLDETEESRALNEAHGANNNDLMEPKLK